MSTPSSVKKNAASTAIAREAWGTWAMLLTKRLANRFEFQRIVREAIDKATEPLKKTIVVLRRDLADPPPDVQEAVIEKLDLVSRESRAAQPQEWTPDIVARIVGWKRDQTNAEQDIVLRRVVAAHNATLKP